MSFPLQIEHRPFNAVRAGSLFSSWEITLAPDPKLLVEEFPALLTTIFSISKWKLLSQPWKVSRRRTLESLTGMAARLPHSI